MSHRLTLICDACGKEFMIDEVMDIPPYWLAVQVAIGDGEGFVPDGEQNKFMHFCGQECLVEFAKSTELKERIMLIDKQRQSPSQEEDEENDD